jgi:hypothetical protein
MAIPNYTHTCEQCGNEYIAHKRTTRYCSRRCFAIRRMGPGKIRQPLTTRFWAKVQKGGPDDCWLWTSASNVHGYGVIGRGGRGSERVLAHRLAWEWEHGPIPPGLFCCHKCDVPACVRVDHLFLGTPADNIHDSMRKGRFIQGERQGASKLRADQVRAIRERYSAGGISQRELAAEYGISQQHVGTLIKLRAWGHVTD